MTKVNQLLEKALSTQSEEEAISCLRLARKRHTGEAVDVKPTAAQQSKELYWREVAEKYLRMAQGYDNQAAIHRRLAAEYLDKYMDESKRSQKLHSENSGLRLNVNLWRGLSAVLFGLMIVAALI